MALTKVQIIDTVKTRLGYTRKESSEIIDSLLEIMKRTMEGGEDILISGFGRFCVREKKARKGRNPATGEDMLLPSRRVITFKCSGKLRERVNVKRN